MALGSESIGMLAKNRVHARDGEVKTRVGSLLTPFEVRRVLCFDTSVGLSAMVLDLIGRTGDNQYEDSTREPPAPLRWPAKPMGNSHPSTSRVERFGRRCQGPRAIPKLKWDFRPIWRFPKASLPQFKWTAKGFAAKSAKVGWTNPWFHQA